MGCLGVVCEARLGRIRSRSVIDSVIDVGVSTKHWIYPSYLGAWEHLD